MDDENIKVADNIKLKQLFNTPKNDYKDIEKENANSSYMQGLHLFLVLKC